MTRRSTLGERLRPLAALLVLMAAPAMAAVPPTPDAPAPMAAPEPPASEADAAVQNLKMNRDETRRLTLQVQIDGKGPFEFLVDTASDRTSISRELAARLGLKSGPDVIVHATAGADAEPTAIIDTLSLGGRTLRHIQAPSLAAADLGADGILGVDALRDLHLVMDFRRMRLSSTKSQAEPIDPRTIVVQGKYRYGELILTHSTIRGVPVLVVVDSGSQLSIGNPALLRLLAGRASTASRRSVQIVSVTGKRTTLELDDVSEADVGGVTIRNMPVGFAQLHTFDRFGLTRQPALLLGMDVLSQCQKVTVDLRRREATFTLN